MPQFNNFSRDTVPRSPRTSPSWTYVEKSAVSPKIFVFSESKFLYVVSKYVYQPIQTCFPKKLLSKIINIWVSWLTFSPIFHSLQCQQNSFNLSFSYISLRICDALVRYLFKPFLNSRIKSDSLKSS